VSLITPDKIRRLQRTLYVTAKQSPARRFHVLYDKVWRADILAHAYALSAIGCTGAISGAARGSSCRTGIFANGEGALRNHGMIDLQNLTLTVSLSGRICGDGL
jgi:hypothetical protein